MADSAKRIARRAFDLRLAVCAACAGVLAAVVSIAFRSAIELGNSFMAPQGFESLAPPARAMLPVAGSLIAVAVLFFIGRGRLRVGVVHVLEELADRGPRLPFTNAALQFFAGTMLLMFGMPLGREGPAIHLGAASASLFGQWRGLDDATVRILLASGVTAAIAAAFNTPVAAMMLAFEVVLMEYRLNAIVPVAVASLIGACLGWLCFGTAPAFEVPSGMALNFRDAPVVAACGIVIGTCAAVFISLIATTLRLTRRWAWWRPMLIAAACAALCGLAVPQVLGIGYDVIGHTLLGRYGLATLAGIVVLKLIATALAVGARMPGGLIGPTFLIGAAAGALSCGIAGEFAAASSPSQVGLYAAVGMGAMMGATLRAPLAALAAAFELTGNPQVVLPTLFALAMAMLVAKRAFGCSSVFEAQMREMRPRGP